MTKPRVTTAAVLVLVALNVVPAAGQESDSTRERSVDAGVYTAEQADRGRTAFRQDCAACHASAEFTGAVFLNRWGSATAYQMFDFLRTQMPFDNPGSLEPAAYVAVIAYLLELNGLPTGDTELPTDPAALRQIPLTPPSDPEP